MTTFEDNDRQAADVDGRIAIIGMSGRFPGAADVPTFWSNLRSGVESIRQLSTDELLAAGESYDSISDPSYVPYAAPLEDIDQFDAPFFGMSPRDASIFDPQHRLLLECAWETFEQAGYVGAAIDGNVGVFASCGLNEYMTNHVLANDHIRRTVGDWLIRHTGNDTNFLATRISYELNLQGPSLNVQTACSSALVAVHLACQSLLSGECDYALAGGAVVAPSQHRGYLYKEGEILSPDGHCRAFDAQSAGTVGASAAGCVLLKPLAAALADGDHVLAVIRGSAMNNDGRDKVGYLAPSIGGQARVVAEALAVANVEASDLSYIEAHGTGTLIGDPIEVAGLTQAFRQQTDQLQFCAIGSVKSNIGHTGEASGIVGLIKTVLCLQHQELVPSLHCATPNPQADFANSPFFVSTSLQPWTVEAGRPRIAGVTGLGAGGTNVHVIVQEAPQQPTAIHSLAEPLPADSAVADRPQLIVLSARTESARHQMALNLGQHLLADPTVNLADVAFTLASGRTAMRCRQALVAASADQAAALLDAPIGSAGITGQTHGEQPSIAFMMPGGGAQYAGMGLDLYGTEAVYADAVDQCLDLLEPGLQDQLTQLLFARDDLDSLNERLQVPSLALPALFITQWATTQLLHTWGVSPAAVIGHSAGEYVAACLAGVLRLEDALALVVRRGELFDSLPHGGMLSVSIGEDEVRAILPSALSIAAVNTPQSCVVSGAVPELAAFQSLLSDRNIDAARVHIDVAAHSAMLEPILEPFRTFCQTIRFRTPELAYISTLTGTWADPAQVVTPDYWVRHLRHTVRFSDGLATLLASAPRVLIEIGPGRTLAGFARQSQSAAIGITTSMRHPQEHSSDRTVLLQAVGRLWCAGAGVDLAALFIDRRRVRVPLPTYPFERQRHWIDPDPVDDKRANAGGPLRKRHEIDQWFSTPAWKRSVITPSASSPATAEAAATPVLSTGPHTTMLIVGRRPALSDALNAHLANLGDRIVRVAFGDRMRKLDAQSFEVNPSLATDWVALFEHLSDGDLIPDRIIHASAVSEPRQWMHPFRPTPLAALDETIRSDHSSLMFLAQVLSGLSNPIRLCVVTTGVVSVGSEPLPNPERALLHGVGKVIPRELANVTCNVVDVEVRHADLARLASQIADELDRIDVDSVVALRGNQRWIQRFDIATLPTAATSPWPDGGVYLITGGLGGIGLAVAEHIAQTSANVTLVLVGRTLVESPDQWDAAIADPDTDQTLVAKLVVLQRIIASGAAVIVKSADVTDRVALTAIRDDVQRRIGPVTTIIHAAGILRDSLLALRTPHVGSPVIDVKARGILVLEQVFAKSPPQLLVIFSSVSSLLGLPGQADYTAANAFLDAFASSRSGNQCTRTVVVNWNAWQEVGMAADSVRDAADLLATTATAIPFANIAEGGWFDAVEVSGDIITRSVELSRDRHWLLDEHVVVGGDALIPGTGYLELLHDAASNALRAKTALELRNVFFISPFVVGPAERRTLRIRFDQTDQSLVAFSDSLTAPHVTASISQDVTPSVDPIDLESIRRRCTLAVQEFDGFADQSFMNFGPRWGNLRRVERGQSEALVTTRIPDQFLDELSSMWLHPAVLDNATGAAQMLIPGFVPEHTFYVPFAYDSVTVFSPIPATAISHVRLRPSPDTALAIFDVDVCNEAGQVSVSISGFTMRLLAGDSGSELARARSTAALAGSPGTAETAMVAALREGIRTSEGVEALDRIVAFDLGPQVIASSVHLETWIAQTDLEARSTDRDDGQAALAINQSSRPVLMTAFEAPQTPIEVSIAAMWQELLGVDTIGRHDDFFELGGQSLIAVRLFSRIRKAFQVDLPLATLFEAPTIAQCAAVIASRLGRNDSVIGVQPEQSTSTDNVQAFRSLVTIQRGGAKLPFFCVHGAGGNTLNFRDLSVAMGRDQPFYGLQARGVDGVLRPHGSIEAMAVAYLDEIREVRPHGPYLLGGYSGGGLVAYEMAQRLTAAGESVALVLLLDTLPPILPVRPQTWRMRLRRLNADPVSFFRNALSRRKAARIEALADREVRQALERSEAVPLSMREHQLGTHFSAIAGAYVRQPWAGRVVLLRPETMLYPFDQPDEAYGWDELVGDQFELIETPGSHLTILVEPNVQVLVRRFAAALRNAQVAAVAESESVSNPGMTDEHNAEAPASIRA